MTCRMWKQSGNPNTFFLCHFIFLTANIAIPLLYTISAVLEIYPLEMKAQTPTLDDDIRVCRRWLFSTVDICIFCELFDSVDIGFGYRVDP